MQKTIIFLLFLILILACKPEYTRNNTILTAEDLLYTNPDSSYKILKSIKSPRQLPVVDYAAWCLNYVHARYKLYIDEKKDTILLNYALKYFQKNGPKKYLGISYFLKGCFAKIDSNKTKTIVYLKKSIKILENSNEYDIIGLAYIYLSQLYLEIEIDYEARYYINKAIECFKKSGNEIYLYYAYRTSAEVSLKTEEPIQKAIEKINSCEKLVLKHNDTLFHKDLIIFKAQVFADINRNYSKEIFLKEFSKLKNKSNQITAYLSFIYARQGIFDSAMYYHKLISLKDKHKIDEFIYEIASAYALNSNNNYEIAFKHLENALQIKQKRFSQNNKTLLLNIDKQYDYSQKDQERAKLEIANQQKIILIISLFVLILIGIFVQLQIRNRHKLKQNSMALEQKLLQFEIESQKRQHIQSLALIQANINNKIENTVKYKKLNTGLTNKEKIDDFIADVAKQAVVSENELDFYMQEADNLFGNRISKLKFHFPQLTTSDLIVISLICLRVDFNNICILLNISLNTLYTRRKRIKAHMGFDKNIDLETWIEQNIIKPE